MKRRIFVASGTAFAAGIGSAGAMVPRASLREKLTTRAESSTYQATSTYADVVKFLAGLDQRGAPIFRTSLGRTKEGREIPIVIASRPRVSSAEEARALKRPIVLVVSSLHGNEVDGKEAILAVLRDLCLATDKSLLDDLVLAIVPIANPDGHERFGPAQSNAPEQNGPARVGVRGNGSGAEIDDDFVKLETPEARALLAFVDRWQPDVYIDLRTSGGSYHEFGITHAPSLHPAAFFGGSFARDNVLANAHKELHEKFAVETFTSGHFGRTKALPAPPPPVDLANYGWFAPDHRPRHATNYMGVRGIVALSGASYAHDPFERRVYCSRAFVESVLGYCSEYDEEVRGNTRLQQHWLGGAVSIRAAFPHKPPPQQVISWENLALYSGGVAEAGVPPGLQRTGAFSSAPMPVYDRYVSTLNAGPVKAYLVPFEYSPRVVPLLQRHSIIHEFVPEPREFRVQQFVVGAITPAADAVDGHVPITVSGAWRRPFAFASLPNALLVSCLQPLGPLVSVLLEPEGDDSFFTWNAFQDELRVGFLAPVFRVL